MKSATDRAWAARTERSLEELFSRFKRLDDQAALEELVRRCHSSAYQVARCICRNDSWAEEAVQNAFLKLLSPSCRFEFRGPGSFRSWFLALVTNSARMARRSERRAEARKQVDLNGYLNRRKPIGPLTDRPVAEEWRGALEASLRKLEERWSTPVRLHFLSGMQQKEVAAILGVSQQMVSRRIVQGLEALRRGLVEAC